MVCTHQHKKPLQYTRSQLLAAVTALKSNEIMVALTIIQKNCSRLYLHKDILAVKKGAAIQKTEQGGKVVKSKVVAKKWLLVGSKAVV